MKKALNKNKFLFMRNDALIRLNHISESIRRIESYTENIFLEEFERSELIQDAVFKNLEIIGEATYKLKSSFKLENPNIQWKKIEGLRHRLVHDYYEIDIEIIWNTIQKRIPELKSQIEELRNKMK